MDHITCVFLLVLYLQSKGHSSKRPQIGCHGYLVALQYFWGDEVRVASNGRHCGGIPLQSRGQGEVAQFDGGAAARGEREGRRLQVEVDDAEELEILESVQGLPDQAGHQVLAAEETTTTLASIWRDEQLTCINIISYLFKFSTPYELSPGLDGLVWLLAVCAECGKLRHVTTL